ncbi:MAG: TIGR02996 domain-containing protein [Gemmataceae bacterium]
MSIEADLLNAIHAAPLDDSPRLIYADFLADRGDPASLARAEFIRIQLALARLPPDHPRAGPLLARQADLLQQYHAAWTAPLRGLVAGVEFRRGILDTVSVDAEQFLKSGHELFRQMPIRKVRILNGSRILERIARSHLLESIVELDLAGTELGNGGLNILLRSTYLSGVESLDLGFNGLDDRAAIMLAESQALPVLNVLSLSDNRLTGEGVRVLAESAWFPRLRWLDLTANAMTDTGIRAIVSRSGLNLHGLRFTLNPVGDQGFVALTASSLFTRLMEREPRLEMRRTGLTSRSCSILASEKRFEGITHLDLSENEIDSAGVKLLASASFPRLRHLSLRGNRIDDEGGIALARSPLMKTVSSFDLANNNLTQVAVDELLSARRTPQAVVELSGNFLGPGKRSSIID